MSTIFPGHGAQERQALIRAIVSTLWELILLAMRGKESAEAASMLPQVSALLSWVGFVARLCGWHWERGKLLQPPEDLGSPLFI
jgi:hypothetical protein